MKIVLISDTHGLHRKIGYGGYNGCPPLPEGDILIHAGDVGESKHDVRDFMQWLEELDYVRKFFIAGNHDRYIANKADDFRTRVKHYKTITYLEDQAVNFDGYTIYGSPWTRNLPSWAYQVDDEDAKECWSNIPITTDILVTHGPPYGVMDQVCKHNLRGREDASVGCKALLERVKVVKPKLHVFGHIHEGRGIQTDGDTTFINASVLDENYYHWPAKAITFEID